MQIPKLKLAAKRDLEYQHDEFEAKNWIDLLAVEDA